MRVAVILVIALFVVVVPAVHAVKSVHQLDKLRRQRARVAVTVKFNCCCGPHGAIFGPSNAELTVMGCVGQGRVVAVDGDATRCGPACLAPPAVPPVAVAVVPVAVAPAPIPIPAPFVFQKNDWPLTESHEPKAVKGKSETEGWNYAVSLMSRGAVIFQSQLQDGDILTRRAYGPDWDRESFGLETFHRYTFESQGMLLDDPAILIPAGPSRYVTHAALGTAPVAATGTNAPFNVIHANHNGVQRDRLPDAGEIFFVYRATSAPLLAKVKRHAEWVGSLGLSYDLIGTKKAGGVSIGPGAHTPHLATSCSADAMKKVKAAIAAIIAQDVAAFKKVYSKLFCSQFVSLIYMTAASEVGVVLPQIDPCLCKPMEVENMVMQAPAGLFQFVGILPGERALLSGAVTHASLSAKPKAAEKAALVAVVKADTAIKARAQEQRVKDLVRKIQKDGGLVVVSA